MVFSVVLIAPSWGGMLNGLLTLKGAWHTTAYGTDPILKFMVVGRFLLRNVRTFEGPMMSIRAVNALSHYTDWTIGHVHGGALGWVGMTTFAMLYYMVPRLWKKKIYNEALVSTHFWLASFGLVIYVVAMWVAGVTQGLQWRALNPEGGLAFPQFLDTVTNLIPFYWVRTVGGAMYLVGVFLMIWNFIMTIRQSDAGPGSMASDEAEPEAVPAE